LLDATVKEDPFSMLCLRLSLSMMLALAAGCAEGMPAVDTVSIRIHDYTGAGASELQQAERRAADMYLRIGITLDWQRPVHPDAMTPESWPREITDITVVMLTGRMAARLRVPEGVVGYAPITRERGGRVAFILGERTRAIAAGAGVDHADVLGGVVAHELAHLLMPKRSHSLTGVMRPHWYPAEFGDESCRRFSEAEAASIRQQVRVLRAGQHRVDD
jgi:hypothetical protein